jgi:hypothetical protein
MKVNNKFWGGTSLKIKIISSFLSVIILMSVVLPGVQAFAEGSKEEKIAYDASYIENE